MPGEERQRFLKSFLIVFFIFLLDQSLKFWVKNNLSLGKTIPIIKDVFHLTLVYNQGIAFGMFKEINSVFIIVVSCLVIFMFYKILRQKTKEEESTSLYLYSLSLILGGAIGNLMDRIFLGYVVDFLDFRIWPVFNIADSAITIGMILLGYLAFFKK